MKLRELCIVIFLCQPQLALAQLSPHAEDKQRLEQKYEEAFTYIEANEWRKGLETITEAENLAWRLGDTLKMVKTGRVKAHILQLCNETDASLYVYEQQLPMILRYKDNNIEYLKEFTYVLQGMALILTFKADYARALELQFLNLKAKEIIGDQKQIAAALNNIGLIYYKQGQYYQAIEYYNKALESRTSTENVETICNRYSNLGLCYIYLRNHQMADYYIEKAAQECKNPSDDYLLGYEYVRGNNFFHKKLYEQSKTHLDASLRLSRKRENKRFEADNLLLLGRIAQAERNYTEAQKLLAQAEDLAIHYQFGEMLISIYQASYQLFGSMGQIKRESVYKGKYIELRDSLYSASTRQQINRLTIELSQQKNITTISDQKKLANLQQQLIAQHVFQKRLTIAIAILLSVIVILLVLGYIRKVRFEKLLESKVKQRTLELEANRNELQLALHQHRQFIQHVCLDTKVIADNLTGLRHLADLDITDPQAREYFSQIGSINNRMFQLLNRLKEPRFGQDA